VAHRRVGCDSGAEEWRDSREIEVGGNAQNEAFINDDAIGATTIGDTSKVLVWGVVGEGLVWAELLKTSFAMGTSTVRIYKAADPGEVPGLYLVTAEPT
jgi:hypothetical protein